MIAGAAETGGRLGDNLLLFGRVLRTAGIAVPTSRIADAAAALAAVGLARRDDAYGALAAVFVTRRDQRPIFDRAFDLFWRAPDRLERMMAAPRPTPAEAEQPRERPSGGADAPSAALMRRDLRLAFSADEAFARQDFEAMTEDERARAKVALRALARPPADLQARRFAADPWGPQVDARRSLRAALRSGHGAIPLLMRRRRTRPGTVVALCDISGSMETYSRLLLHFLHGLRQARAGVHVFAFGTRLSNLTRALAVRNADAALTVAGEAAPDWGGGTRIGAALHAFNRDWSRRVLARGAVVLLITDGLDRDGGTGIAAEADRLRRSCRRLIWLNPLLRYAAFEARAAGVRALAAEVDEMRPIHDLASVEALARDIAEPSARRAGRTQRIAA